jgi:hypothetical protein
MNETLIFLADSKSIATRKLSLPTTIEPLLDLHFTESGIFGNRPSFINFLRTEKSKQLLIVNGWSIIILAKV